MTPAFTIPPIAHGSAGALWLGQRCIGHLTDWRIVISPTTQQPTLFGEGTIQRYWTRMGAGGTLEARLAEDPAPIRYGRPKPPAPRAYVLRGTIARLTATAVTLSHGELYINGLRIQKPAQAGAHQPA